MTKKSLEDILADREAMYGSFKKHSTLAQNLKEVMRDHDKWIDLPSKCKEALEMIQTKVARVINGRHNVKDSWDDIAGYAQCVSEDLQDM